MKTISRISSVYLLIAFVLLVGATSGSPDQQTDDDDDNDTPESYRFHKQATFPNYPDEHVTAPAMSRSPEEMAEWLPVKERLGVKEGMAIADIGCGTGAHTFLLAHAVGPEGKIYALDVQQKLLDVVQQRIKDPGMNPYQNVVAIINRFDSTLLEPEVLDAAMLINVHFHVYWPPMKENILMMESIYQALKPGGRLLIEDGNLFQPPDTVENTVRNYESVGFVLEKEPELFGQAEADFTYYAVFRKPEKN